MVESDDPSKRLTERCRRLARAARIAAMPSGVSTKSAITIPPRAAGAPISKMPKSTSVAMRLDSSTIGNKVKTMRAA